MYNLKMKQTGVGGIVFNLYDTLKKEYLGTYTNANINFELDHFIPKVNDEQGGNNKKELTFVDSYGNTLIYNGNKQFNFIDINNNSFLNNGNIYYNPSL